jgi:hypothetical protein
MVQFLKQIPLVPKIIVGIAMLGTIGKLVSMNEPNHPVTGDGEVRTVVDAGRQTASPDTSQAEQLAALRAQYAELNARLAQCQQQVNAVNAEMQRVAVQGYGTFPDPPACQPEMWAWTSQLAVVQTQIRRIETGDASMDVYDGTGIARPSEATTSSYNPSAGEPNGEADGVSRATDDYERAVARGTEIYTDEEGDQYELSYQGYHFKDRNSGEIVTTATPDPPNDGHDYEPLRPARP